MENRFGRLCEEMKGMPYACICDDAVRTMAAELRVLST